MPNPEAPACECRWFSRAVADETVPVIFNEMMNEYHLLRSDGRGHHLFYYCPFCGGRAPKSLRSSYWTEVSIEESFRLHELTKTIQTSEQLFSTFGQPDSDFEIGGGCTSPGSEEEPPETSLGPRRVVFKSLSETADVHVRIDRYDRLKFSFAGRYIGPAQSEQGYVDGKPKPDA